MADAKLLFFPRKAEKEGGNVAENCDREGRGEKSGPRRDISRRTELTDEQETELTDEQGTGQEAKKDGARARTGRGKGERQARQRGKGRQRKKESRPKQRLALDGFVGTMGNFSSCSIIPCKLPTYLTECFVFAHISMHISITKRASCLQI